jgi:hypothetical protein
MNIQIVVLDVDGYVIRFQNFNSTREKDLMTQYIAEALSDFKVHKIEMRKWR